jgi:hypothetical protein
MEKAKRNGVFFWHFGSELLMSLAQLFQLSNSVEIGTTLAALWQIGCSIVFVNVPV